MLEIHAQVKIRQVAKAMIAYEDYAQIAVGGCNEVTAQLHNSTSKLALDRVVAIISTAKDLFDNSAAGEFLESCIADLKAERQRLAKVRAARKLQFA